MSTITVLDSPPCRPGKSLASSGDAGVRFRNDAKREGAGRLVRPEWPRPARYRHCPWRYRVRGLEPGYRPARYLTRRDVALLA